MSFHLTLCSCGNWVFFCVVSVCLFEEICHVLSVFLFSPNAIKESLITGSSQIGSCRGFVMVVIRLNMMLLGYIFKLFFFLSSWILVYNYIKPKTYISFSSLMKGSSALDSLFNAYCRKGLSSKGPCLFYWPVPAGSLQLFAASSLLPLPPLVLANLSPRTRH